MQDEPTVERQQRVPGSVGIQASAEVRTERSVFVRDEVALARSADRTKPGVGDVLERCPARDAAVGIAVLGVVDVAAGLADPALEGLGGGAHTSQITCREGPSLTISGEVTI